MATVAQLDAEAAALAERLETGWQHIERGIAEGAANVPKLEAHFYTLLARYEVCCDWAAIQRAWEAQHAPKQAGPLRQGQMAISAGRWG